MLNSTSSNLPRSCLRATSSARISCDPIDLACTCWNHPIRSSCASPHASLRSVFAVIADSAAFTCRVSSRTAIVITAPPQAQSDSPERQVPSRNKQELPVRLQPSPPLRSCLAHPQRKRSRVPKRRRFRHSAPRLSSISDAWGRLNVVTPFHHLSGDSHLHRSLGAGPITASSCDDLSCVDQLPFELRRPL